MIYIITTPYTCHKVEAGSIAEAFEVAGISADNPQIMSVVRVPK